MINIGHIADDVLAKDYGRIQAMLGHYGDIISDLNRSQKLLGMFANDLEHLLQDRRKREQEYLKCAPNKPE